MKHKINMQMCHHKTQVTSDSDQVALLKARKDTDKSKQTERHVDLTSASRHILDIL